jgi:hypothetical protein
VRGQRPSQPSFVSLINIEMLIAADHQILAIKRMCDEALGVMEQHFDGIYAEGGDLTPVNWSIADDSLGSETETQTCQKEIRTLRSRSSRSCAGWIAARRRMPSAGA